MSVIRPFRGLRPRPDHVKEVAAPPYDVLSSEEARLQVKNNPHSFLRVNKPEVDFDASTSVYSQEVYQRGKENLRRLINDGIMCRDRQACFYLYRLTWQGASQTGLVTLSSCAEYENGRIKKHEHTRPDKVNDRADHIQIVEAQVGPVFSIFRQHPRIQHLFDRVADGWAEYDFVSDDDVRHELWLISDPDMVDNLIEAFDALEALYIADGHHRSAAATEVARRLRSENPHHTGNEQYNFFLNVIFPDNELRILPYNRVVKGRGDLSPEQLLEKLSAAFDVTPAPEPIEPTEPYEFGMFFEGRWYTMAAKEGSFDRSHPADSIDSAVLTANLLDPVLGIRDIRTDQNIAFVGGIRGVRELERLVTAGEFDIAFSLYPVSVAQLLAVADAGEVMPPKSTWFEPKLRSGMIVNLLDE